MDIKDYRIEFVDRVLDPVHGFIDLTRVESRIISLPIFRRMQGIKQLSMVNWVFPGAEHTRFIHSLGVMHIADQMAVHLRCFSEGQRQLLRLAGLLHDIGHYPLSHVTESVYKDRHGVEEYNESLSAHNKSIQSKIDGITVKKIPEYMDSRYADRMHHESIGAFVIDSDQDIAEIIREECDFVELEDICDIIVGNVDRKKELSAFVQLMHSELDADGIDYIMRDASFSGTSYGGFELGMLLRNLAITDYNGTQIVGVRPKGIPIVDQYLVNKYFSYTQIIFNKHVAILDFLVEMATHALIDLSQTQYPAPKELMLWIREHCNNEDYLLFTDVFFWSQVTGRDAKGDYINEPYIREMLKMLKRYEEPLFLDEFIITTDDGECAKEKIKECKMYADILSTEKDVFLFHTREFTKEVPVDEYKKIIQNRWNEEHPEKLFIETNTKRLQEGVAVIRDDGSEPKLLVDDPRSVMSALWRNKTYILRRYQCIE